MAMPENWELLLRNQKIIFDAIMRLDKKVDEMKLCSGAQFSQFHLSMSSDNLHDYEFKIFSQWGEDGIIQHLINNIEIKHKTFIEFGVETFFEANCRFLMMKDNWRGFVMDGSADHINFLKQSYFYWKYELNAVSAFITRDNINALLGQCGFDADVGILSVDLDGVDYHVLETINGFIPRILICEYNSSFGKERAISVPYDPHFQRTAKHPSNLYFGASLPALAHIAGKKGYSLVGTNSAGHNAFFVRNDLLNERIRARSVEQAFTVSRFRESRDQAGNLTYVGGDQRIEVIRGLPVINVISGAEEVL
jgi:hypothetical protein